MFCRQRQVLDVSACDHARWLREVNTREAGLRIDIHEDIAGIRNDAGRCCVGEPICLRSQRMNRHRAVLPGTEG